MDPTPTARTTTDEAVPLLETTTTPASERLLKRTRSEAYTHIPTHRPAIKRTRSAFAAITKLIVEAPPSSLGTLHRLAPEIRNAIYSLLLQSEEQLPIVADEHAAGVFTLRKYSSESQRASVKTLRNLSVVSTEVRHEARTYFYAANNFTVCCHNYEYLPVFVRWLEAMGTECRAVLKSVEMHGYQWYQPSTELTQQLHALLRDCKSARKLDLSMNVRHVCEANLAELSIYLDFMGPEPHDGPMPEVDVAEWAQTIASMPKLANFTLEMELRVDEAMIRLGNEKSLSGLSSERGRVLAKDIAKRSRVAIRKSCDRDIAVQVRYTGESVGLRYVPWTGVI